MCAFDEEEVPGQDQSHIEAISARSKVDHFQVANLHDNLAEDVKAKARKERRTTDSQSPEGKTTFNDRRGEDEAHGGDVEKADQDVCKAQIFDSSEIDLTYAVT